MSAAMVKLLAVLVAALCVGSYVVAGEAAVLAVVLPSVAGLACKTAATSRPRPLRRAVRARRAPRASGVRIGDQRNAHIVHGERRQRQRVEHLVEAEPPR